MKKYNPKYIILSVILLSASFSFMKTTFEVMKSKRRFEDVKLEVAQLEQEKALLQEQIAFQQTDDFVEQQARNKLNMVRPGEKIFVVPEDYADQVGYDSSSVLGIDDANDVDSGSVPESSVLVEDVPNYKKWFDVFF